MIVLKADTHGVELSTDCGMEISHGLAELASSRTGLIPSVLCDSSSQFRKKRDVYAA